MIDRAIAVIEVTFVFVPGAEHGPFGAVKGVFLSGRNGRAAEIRPPLQIVLYSAD